MRRDRILEEFCQIWLKVTSEKIAILVEGRRDRLAVEVLPSIVKPEILETQVQSCEVIIRKLRRAGIRKVLVLSDFDKKGRILGRKWMLHLKREGFIVLEQERDRICFLLHQLKINHIEEIKNIARAIRDYLPFSIYKKYCEFA